MGVRSSVCYALLTVTPGLDDVIEPLAALMRGRRVVVLSGAGCSTESGIPDYRGGGTARRARNPVQFRDFVGDDQARRRYWARSVIGWRRVAAAAPNDAHVALAELEARGAVAGVITQNVDGLHGAAGSRRVVELHGALREVQCRSCGAIEGRAHLQDRLLARNPGFEARRAALAPDGDADLPDALVDGFEVVDCERCGGVLKPRVVFFGEGVPAPTVEAAWSLFDEGEVLVVVGSSLAVFSGFRFVRRAAERGVPVAIVNRGETRGDPHAAVRVDAAAGAVLRAVAERLRVS